MFEKAVYKMTKYVKHNSPTILSYLAVGGVVGTVILAIKATPKAIKILDNAEDEKGEELTKLEVVLNAGPTYIPTVLVGVSTIACIFGANVLNQRQQASLASAYALINSSYKEYRAKLKELYGDDKDSEIRAAIMRDKYKAEPPELHAYGFSCLDGLERLCDPGDTVLFYEEFSERYFESTIVDVQAAEYHFNRNFTLRGSATVNELYDFLGLPSTDNGLVLGWDMGDGYSWVDFNHKKVKLDDGLECYILSYEFTPDVLEDY